MATLDQLIAAQNRHQPGSTILSRAEVLERWLFEKKGPSPERAYTNVASAIASTLLNYETVLFYETKNGARGARYGIEAHEYLSGFGDY